MKRLSIIITMFSILIFTIPFTIPVLAEDTQIVSLQYIVNPEIRFVDEGIEDNILQVKQGQTIREPSHLEKNGYQFIGWKDSETGLFWDFSQPVNESMTLIACYNKIDKKSDISETIQATPANTGILSHSLNYAFLILVALAGIVACILIPENSKHFKK